MPARTRISYLAVFLSSLVALILGVESRAQNTDVPKTDVCPEIIVSGPAGVTNPGDLMWFTVSVDPEPTTDLKFHWTTNVGQVTVGQSTRKIGVRSLMEMYGRSATATVKIEGLPNQCPNMASESALLEILLTAVLLDEFSSSINSISIRYLKAAAAELNRNPNNQMYIIEYFPPGTSEVSKKRKKDKIKSFMATTLKFDVDRITIITAEADKPRTKIYRIPPGASNPNP